MNGDSHAGASAGAGSTDAPSGTGSTDALTEVEEATSSPDVRRLLRQVGVVARQEYRLSIRNRWALALAGLFGLFAVLVVAFGGSEVGPGRLDAVIVSLASLATYLLPLAALVFGYDTIVGAHDDGWLDVVFALPTSRARVVVGKYLGRAVVLAAAVVLGFGGAGVLLAFLAGWMAWSLLLVFLVGAVGVGLAFLAVSVLVSTVAREKTHALGLSLLVWVWFVFVHDLLALGVVAALEVSDRVVSAFVLLNPAAVFRVLVLTQVRTTGGGMAAVFADASLSMPVLLLALVAWSVVPLAAASVLVDRRSL